MLYLFWIALFIIFYAFFGYGILLYILVKLRVALKGKRSEALARLPFEWPSVTIIVAAYNEADCMDDKLRNTLDLDYPAEKIKYLFVTDGSTDNTPDVVRRYEQVTLLHQPGRSGKIAAVHRAMKEVNTDIVIFTDANTLLNKQAIKNICRHYADVKVGAVAGEKRVKVEDVSDATAGEGFYWKYESTLKRWDSELYSVVGAAGELFSVRTSLYQPVSPNSILDDFMISMLIAEKGYRIVYEPEAYATENSSANVKEELKRKIRIAAGGIQSICWLTPLLNPFKYPVLSFQYVSHRVLRWTIVPFLMILVLILNFIIVIKGAHPVYTLVLDAQLAFYVAALAGWFLEKREIKIKILFIPYYFCMMNYAVLAGIKRFISGKQAVTWEKAKRK